MNEPRLIKGGLAVDDRGSVSFVNEFNFDQVKRFYVIKNHAQGFIRAWHGHKQEAKYFTVTKGSFLVACVGIDDWDTPSKDLKIHRYVLSEHTPSVLYIPAGYANGSMNLSSDAALTVFSTSTVEASLKDDFRYPSRFWNPWEVEER